MGHFACGTVLAQAHDEWDTLRTALCGHWSERAVHLCLALKSNTPERSPTRAEYIRHSMYDKDLEINDIVCERGGGLGSRPIFKKFHETYAPS